MPTPMLLLALLPASATAFNTTLLDCGVRKIIYEQALALQPWRGPHQRDTFDALLLDSLCGDAAPPIYKPLSPIVPYSRNHPLWVSAAATNGNGGDGSFSKPFASIEQAVNNQSRKLQPTAPNT